MTFYFENNFKEFHMDTHTKHMEEQTTKNMWRGYIQKSDLFTFFIFHSRITEK